MSPAAMKKISKVSIPKVLVITFKFHSNFDLKAPPIDEGTG
jgi:hypothetical protein